VGRWVGEVQMGRMGQVGLRSRIACVHALGLMPSNPAPCCAVPAGLNRLAHFLALDTFDHVGTVMRSAVYFIMYYSFAAPR